MTLLAFIDKLTHATENGEYAIGVFLDISKPFIPLTITFCWINYTIMESEAVLFLGSRIT